MIKCENISLSFDGQSIIQDLNFEIERGMKACICGVSGKGKTTVLKLLQGYLSPDSGTIKVNGLNITEKNIDQIRKGITWVPQNIHLPVENGVELLRMLNAAHKKEEVLRYLNQLGLNADMIDKNFTEMSVGQKQRVVIAACLTLDGDILLMDEPTSALDNHSIEKLISTINSLENKTILSVSHNSKWIDNSDLIIEL